MLFNLLLYRLALLYSTIIFLSREAFVRASAGKPRIRNLQTFINTLWLMYSYFFTIIDSAKTNIEIFKLYDRKFR